MMVRKLRITPDPPVGASQSIDAVTDPYMLAHRLLKLETTTESRSFDSRLRMSAMHRVCVRAQLLGLREHLQPRESLPASMRVTYDLGTAIHLFLQNGDGYLGSARVGWWRCLACGRKTFGRQPLSQKCACGANPKAIQYEEHSLHMPKGVPVSGHIDGFLEVSPGDFRVIDFKTINGPDFDTLTEPKPEHLMQVNGYMHYVQMDDTLPIRINREKGLLLYVSKKHCGRSLPFKMFHVGKDKMILDVIENKVAEFLRGKEDSSYLPPVLTSCEASQFKSAACRACHAYSECLRQHNYAIKRNADGARP